MLSKFVMPGSKAELKEVERSRFDEEHIEPKVYESKVYDILSDEKIALYMPMDQQKLILLPVDAEYDVAIYEGKVLYQFMGRVVDRYKSNNVYILVLELESNLRKIQRREYYRFSCALDMCSRSLSEAELESLSKSKRKNLPIEKDVPLRKCIIVDISGGGLRFISSEEYPKDRLIFCQYKLQLEQVEKDYCLVGRVLSSRPVEHKPGTFESRVQYVDINFDEREEIIKYIFQEERKNRRKESGF